MADKICFSFWNSKTKIKRDIYAFCAATPKVGEEVYFDGLYVVESIEHSMSFRHMDESFYMETTVFLGVK